MSLTHCPICYEELEVVETTPCMDCGPSERSLEILRQDIKENYAHDSATYSKYRAFEKFECVICDLCTYDFMSYDPTYFGFNKDVKLWPSNFQFLKQIETPKIEKDKYCTNCGKRLAFLLFLKQVRGMNNA